MGSPASWLADTFSSEAKEDDLIKSRSLNITRIVAVVTPVLAGIWTAISEWTEQPPFDDPEFQRQLVLAFIGLIAIVTTADVLSRAISAHKVAAPLAVATPLPSALKVTLVTKKKRELIKGRVVAFRATNADKATESGEFLFVADDGATSWETTESIRFADG